MPIGNWVKYVSVEPLETKNKIGEELIMLSTRNVKKGGHIDWLDLLICNNRNVYGRYSATSTHGNVQGSGVQVRSWIYEGKLPNFPTECYMESNITLDLGRGVTKQQVIQSSPFSFIY